MHELQWIYSVGSLDFVHGIWESGLDGRWRSRNGSGGFGRGCGDAAPIFLGMMRRTFDSDKTRLKRLQIVPGERQTHMGVALVLS